MCVPSADVFSDIASGLRLDLSSPSVFYRALLMCCYEIQAKYLLLHVLHVITCGPIYFLDLEEKTSHF